MANWHHVYVVYRYDRAALKDDNIPTNHALTIKEILPTEEDAVREVDRLNALNHDKGCAYSFQSAKYYPDGRSVE